MSNTFNPGPTPNTVRAADGRILTGPDGWILLPPGDAALTRRVKTAGDHWVVAEMKGRKVFSRGVWAPAATIERIRAELDAERSTEGFAMKKEADARRLETAQSLCEKWAKSLKIQDLTALLAQALRANTPKISWRRW